MLRRLSSSTRSRHSTPTTSRCAPPPRTGDQIYASFGTVAPFADDAAEAFLGAPSPWSCSPTGASWRPGAASPSAA